jgi:hypothetical protein
MGDHHGVGRADGDGEDLLNDQRKDDMKKRAARKERGRAGGRAAGGCRIHDKASFLRNVCASWAWYNDSRLRAIFQVHFGYFLRAFPLAPARQPSGRGQSRKKIRPTF